MTCALRWAVYPLKSLSKGGWIKYRMPYLLRGLRITRRNQGLAHRTPGVVYAAAAA